MMDSRFVANPLIEAYPTSLTSDFFSHTERLSLQHSFSQSRQRRGDFRKSRRSSRIRSLARSSIRSTSFPLHPPFNPRLSFPNLSSLNLPGRIAQMQVANHELLGHGSGKEFQEGPEGTFNFDREIINPLTGRKVESWYKNGQSDSHFLWLACARRGTYDLLLLDWV